jgi:hypothetical protein
MLASLYASHPSACSINIPWLMASRAGMLLAMCMTMIHFILLGLIAHGSVYIYQDRGTLVYGTLKRAYMCLDHSSR